MFIEMFVIIVVKLKIILWCFVFLGINIICRIGKKCKYWMKFFFCVVKFIVKFFVDNLFVIFKIDLLKKCVLFWLF